MGMARIRPMPPQTQPQNRRETFRPRVSPRYFRQLLMMSYTCREGCDTYEVFDAYPRQVYNSFD